MANPDDLWGSSEEGPFTADRRVVLRDFTVEQLQPAAELLCRSDAEDLLERVHYWTAGHPFLTMSVLDALQSSSGDADETVARLFFDKPAEHSSNLHFVQTQLVEGVRDLYRKVLGGEEVPAAGSADVKRLLLSGVVVDDGGFLRVRNRIYGTAFDERRLLEMERPGPFRSGVE
jgi:hypothetical protein